MAALKYWVWLSTLGGLRRSTLKKLIEEMSSPETVYFAREEDYIKLGIPDGERKRLENKSMFNAKRILNDCQKYGFRIMTIGDADYPERLKNIFDPPIVLYVKGKLPEIDEEAAVAIVGTRKCTPYGIKTAERFGYEIAKAGGLVVSGLAEGVDSAAAKGALRAGGKVVGVIGCGLDIVYPACNGALFKDVSDIGAIISEYAPGTPPYGTNFPVRNRILSGISVGTVVIEAPERSGALITAARALEQGRDVFAVPGNVDAAACSGSNKLIKEGAIPATSGWDIIDEYIALFPDKLGLSQRKNCVPLDEKMAQKLVENELKIDKNIKVQTKKEIDKAEPLEYIDLVERKDEFSEDEVKIVRLLDGKVMHIDEIINKTELSASAVLAAMTMLEIKGIVVQKSGKNFLLSVAVK